MLIGAVPTLWLAHSVGAFRQTGPANGAAVRRVWSGSGDVNEWQAFVPGTRMTFTGLPNEQDRADVIAYLESLK